MMWSLPPEEPVREKPTNIDPAEFEAVRRRQEQLAERVRIVEAQVRALQGQEQEDSDEPA